MINIKGLDSAALIDALAPHAADARTARRLQAAVCRSGSFPDALDEVSPALLSRIRDHFSADSLTRMERHISPADGFARYVCRGEDEGCFEAVRIPLTHVPGKEKYVVCVSTQVGCSVGCAFCATGALGFRRDLAAWEIVDQVIHIRNDSAYPVRGVVFMGMGEPLLNYDQVMRAAAILAEPSGLAIGAKAITVSTAGIVPGIRRFAAERMPYRLIVSLSAADQEKRARLIPAAASWPLDELLQSLREYHAVSGARVTLAWTMIAGVNCGEDDARALGALVKGLPVTIDLIDVNDPSGAMLPPSDDERNTFHDALRRFVGAPVARRYSGGKDIDAACGMLAGRIS